MEKIYIILWVGRDSDNGIWDSYPMYSEGFFTDKDKALDRTLYLNNLHNFEYDKEADDTPHFEALEVNKHKED